MITEKHYDILISPVYSEKATAQTSLNKYTFKVCSTANKEDVRKAVGKIFDVKVVAVNILTKKSKARVFKGIKGRKKGFKKAVVTLQKGVVINFNKGA
jgi:large subunit ribosomal protein L23